MTKRDNRLPGQYCGSARCGTRTATLRSAFEQHASGEDRIIAEQGRRCGSPQPFADGHFRAQPSKLLFPS